MQASNPSWTQYLVPILIVVIVFGLRLFRMRRAKGQRLRLETLWIVPAIYAVAAGLLLWSTPPAGPVAWLLVILALAIGAGVGWQRGRSIRIEIDPVTHKFSQRASPLTMLILAALILLRMGIRAVATEESAAWHVSAALITDLFVALALGLFAATRAEMAIRARRMLAAARGAPNV